MSILAHHPKHSRLGALAVRTVVASLIFSLVFYQPMSYAQQAFVLGLPKPGTMVDLSPAYVPVLIKGLKVHQDNPLAMDFIVDTGDSGLKLDQAQDKQKLSQESEKLIKYFLAALTLPEKDVWVNLSPYEKDRIIPAELGQTQMGRDMLAEDYILKQMTASLIYPEKGLGKDFWDRVYKASYQRFGTTQIPVNTFNKVWIVADRAKVYENKDTAFVIGSHLKVMLEQDYLSLVKHSSSAQVLSTTEGKTNALGSQIVREIILPALEKEVNQGKNFANLRQIFYSLILAKWYKQALKQALLNQVYSNKNKVAGVDVEDKTITRKIYDQYLKAYKKGVFNFIKEDIDQATQQPLPRKYFSGGVVGDVAMSVTHQLESADQDAPRGTFVLDEVTMGPINTPHTVGPNPGVVTTNGMDEGAGLFGDDREDGAWDEAMAARTFAPSTSVGKKTYSPDNVRHLKLSDQNKKELEAAQDVTDNFKDKFINARRYLLPLVSGMSSSDPMHEGLLDAVSKIDEVKIKFVNSGNVLRYGYALDKVNNIIYLDKKGVAMVNDVGYFDFLTREIIRMVAGVKYAYLYAFGRYTTNVRRKFPGGSEPTDIIKRNRQALLLPVDARGNPVSQKTSDLEAIVQGIIPDSPARGLKIEPPNENSYNIMKESNALMEQNFYEMGIYFLNGIVDAQGDFKSFMNGIDKSIKLMNSFLVFFATKANPITLAHLNVTIASVMKEAVRYFGQGQKLSLMDVVNVSKEDPLRKPEVGKTYEPRLFFAQYVISAIFGSIVYTLPEDEELGEFIDYLKSDPELSQFITEVSVKGVTKDKVFDHFNGEENFHRLIRIFHTIGIKMFGYPVGGDHLRVFVKMQGRIKADRVDNQLTRDMVTYYPKINPRFYADLIIGQHQIGEAKIYDAWITDSVESQKVQQEARERIEALKKDQSLNGDGREKLKKLEESVSLWKEQMALKQLYEDLLNAKSDSELVDIFEKAPYLPRLDTCGKLAIINSEYGDDMDLVLFHTVRGGEDVADAFRDQLTKGVQISGRNIKGVPIIDVKGIEATMNATGIREALVKVVRDGVFSFDGFSSANLTLLEFLFDPSNREMLNIILRQKDKFGNDLILPKSVQGTWHPDFIKGQRELKDHLADLRKKLTNIWGSEAQIKIEEKRIEAPAQQKSKNNTLAEVDVPATMVTLTVDEKEIINLAYYVTNSFGANGEDQNTIRFVYESMPDLGVNEKGVHESLDLMKAEEASFNRADFAMEGLSTPQSLARTTRQVQGGIDFNANQLQMNVQKQGPGVGINFDPELIKQFKNSDFQGFMPVIINIRPIDNIALMLGVGQEEAELTKV